MRVWLSDMRQFTDVRERLWSSHLDQTPLRTLVRECTVALALFKRGKRAKATAEYFVDRFWDRDAKVARTLLAGDLDVLLE